MQIEIQVLGPLRVLVDARPVELGPARRRALLAALALEPGQVVGLDLLADRVWDGDPPASPAATVHAYVSRLRASLRTFGPDGDELPSPLRTHSPGYVLDLPRESLDALRFADGTREARALVAAGDPAAARHAVRDALALWRGDAYADVLPEFARRDADRLRDLRLDAHELAAQVDLALGRHEALVAEVSTLVAGEPFREGLQSAYLLALYRSGRQAEALRHYAVVREQMADELGIDPGPELRALHEAILRQDRELDAPVVASSPLPERVSTSAPSVAAEVLPGQRLVGRDREVARLDAAIVRAASGTLAPVAVAGEAGIGKSRLLEELAARATSAGAAVAWGRCWQHEGAPVLWPWLQALESLAESLDPETVRRALTGRGAGVAALVPSLAGLATETGQEPLAADGALVRLYAAVAAFLEAAGSERTVVLLLEDMHWADLASRELVEYVVTHVRSAHVALVMTVRAPTEDVARTGAELLNALARSGRGERIDLTGLDTPAVAEYVADRTGSLPDAATSSALAERTGGNPFFVGELVRLLVTDVTDDTGEGTELVDAVPDSIRDVIARRLARLPEIDRTVLRVAAVVGRTFDLVLLEVVCGLEEDVVDEAVDRATELGIVCSEAGRIGRHRFVHALTQQTLLDVTGPARVRRIHSRVAQALEERGDDLTAEQAERLAFHLASSGGEAEIERAVDLSLAASDQAVMHGNFPEGESLLLRALELTSRLPLEKSPQRETSARVRLWSLYTATYGPGAPGAAAQQERALDLIRLHGGAREVLGVHQAVFARLIWQDDLDAVAQVGREMAAAAETADDDLMRAAALLVRAQEMLHRGRLREAIAAYDDVRALGPDALLNVPAGIFPMTPRCAMLTYRALAEALAGDEEASARHVAELDRILPDVSVTTVTYSDTMVAFLHAVCDEPGAALVRARHAREAAERHGFVEALLFIRMLEVWARERLQPGAAMADLDTAMAALRVIPTLAHRPTMYGLTARVRLDAGDLDGAEADLAEAFRAQDATGNRLYAAPLHRLRGRLLEARGADSASVSAEHAAAHRVATDQDAHLFLV